MGWQAGVESGGGVVDRIRTLDALNLVALHLRLDH